MIERIIKGIAYFPKFRKAIIEFAFKQQSPLYAENLEFAFIDSTGKRYSRFFDFKKMPMKRVEQMTKLQEAIRAGIKPKDLTEWVKVAETVIEKSKNVKVEMSKLLYSLSERRKLFDEDLLIELAAVLYIREDENPNEFIETLHREKLSRIKNDLSNKDGGIYFFFQRAGLKDFMPSGIGTPQDYAEFTKQQMKKIQELNTEMQRTLSLLNAFKE